MVYFEDRDIFRVVSFVIVLLCAIAFLAYPLANPVDNWDMLGYAASVKSLGGIDPDTIHKSVFAEYKEYATKAHFHELTASSNYRLTMHSDAEAFNQQIPYYKIRIAYVLILALLAKAGIGLFEAMHVVSAISGSAAFLAIYFGLRKHVHSLFWIVTPFFYFKISQDLALLQYAGVDTFAFLWMAATVIAFVKNHRMLLPLLAVTVLIRTDLIIYVGLMFLVVVTLDRTLWGKVAFWGIVTLALYFGVNNWSGNLGWSTLIHFVFISDMAATHPEVFAKYSFDLTQYLGFIFRTPEWVSSWLWLAFGFSATTLVACYLWFETTAPASHTHDYFVAKRLIIIGVVCCAYIVAHYLLFPALWMRFFYGQCYLTLISLFGLLSYLLKTQTSHHKVEKVVKENSDARQQLG